MTFSQSKYSGLLIHITAWAVVIGMPLFVFGTDRPLINMNDYFRFLAVPVSFMLIFYINYFHLIEKFLFARHVGKFLICNVFLILTVMFAVHLLFRYILAPEFMPPLPPLSWKEALRFFSRNSVLYILVAGASVAIRVTGNWYKIEKARQELEHSRIQAELHNLKSQLNPHFLFNTLNNIYSLIQIDTERAQKAVYDLSGMLRYVLYESSRAEVPLWEEVRFLHDYIELMRLRLPHHVKLSVSLPDEKVRTPVAPLLFISLVENAFKHGVSNEKPSYINISLHETNGKLVCRIKNSSFPKPSGSDRSGSGIGIANLAKRLEMIYPGHYSFEYGPCGNGDYEALLSVDFNGNEIELRDNRR